jgi:hypothetical protein
MRDYRSLKEGEITALEKQGCYCPDWSGIQVAENFRTQYIHRVRFDGQVRVGALNGIPIEVNGLNRHTGLYNCTLRNCEIDEEVYLSGIGLISGYKISTRVIIENLDSAIVDGETQFGQGTLVEALNEGGGREIAIFDRLSSHLAYILIQYRHNSKLIDQLRKLIIAYCKTKNTNLGLISKGCSIMNCQTIKNVWIGSGASISGAQLLENGTISNSVSDPVNVGAGVVSRNFIILSGAKIESGALLEKCFIGQGVQIGKQFSAEHSLFFANCEAFHGEAVGLFAGPYTVSHHKSSLLIAGMFSFFNAGSGTNQSNHMYKLGPVHQGILERGCKTGSFAYLLWPSRIGAFSVVMDKHNSNVDTSDLPFSYINKDGDRSMLTPAMNLFTVGTRRDSEKWPKRDKRKDPDKPDLIRFDLFNPYIVAKIARGAVLLATLYDQTPKEQKYIQYKGVTIPRLLLKTGSKYYQLALQKYYGEMLLSRLDELNAMSLKEIRSRLSNSKSGTGLWIDMAGLIAPLSEVEDLLAAVTSGKINDLEMLEKRLVDLHANYETYAWEWFIGFLKQQKGIDLSEIQVDQMTEIIRDWKESSLKLNNMILRDAEKEFDANSRIGYGIDGDELIRQKDFDSVRGTVPENAFIQGLKKENDAIEKKASIWLERLASIERRKY